jgi:hypothetical protein
MRLKHIAMACVVVLAYIRPARADVILTYHLSTFVPANPGTIPPASPIPAHDPLGPAIVGNNAANPLVLTPNETKFLQICIQANATVPIVGGPMGQDHQANWTTASSGNTMTSFAFGMNYPWQLVTQPFTLPSPPALYQNNSNARAQSGPQPDGSPTGYAFSAGYPYINPFSMGLIEMDGVDSNVGLGTTATSAGGVNLLPDTNIAVMKLVAGTTLGSGVITLFDLNPLVADFALVDGTNLDSLIFTPAHGLNGNASQAFPLFISVAAPEPSSICLASLAAAGFAWRKLRRKAIAGTGEPQTHPRRSSHILTNCVSTI